MRYKGSLYKQLAIFRGVTLLVSVLTFVSFHGHSQSPPAAVSENFLLKGKIATSKGSSIAGAHIFILRGPEGQWVIEDGVVKNPTGETDNLGQFSIVIPRSFFSTQMEFMIKVNMPGDYNGSLAKDANNIPIVFKVDGSTGELDMGVITYR